MLRNTLLSLALANTISAHTAPWADGMYCRGGADPNKDEPNTNLAVNPLYNLSQEDWWFQHHRGCDLVPPPTGEFLDLPAKGNFTVELAHNRAFTTLSYDGKLTTDWPDGKEHPADWNGWGADGKPAVCLKEDGALHTYNESSAGGTAFAISYHDKIEDVNMENLVVFTTLYHTPWKRLTTYQVPDLPECPEEGCHCAWLWIPNGCGEPNMYMHGFKCKVTNATSTTPLAKAQIPVHCADDASKCVKGAKQMLAWNQKTGNNIQTEQWVTPNYNQKCGWPEGAQTDIFEEEQEPAKSSTLSEVVSSTSAGSSTFSVVLSTSTTLATVVASPSSSVVVKEQSSTTSVPALSAAAPAGPRPCTHQKRQPRTSARAAARLA